MPYTQTTEDLLKKITRLEKNLREERKKRISVEVQLGKAAICEVTGLHIYHELAKEEMSRIVQHTSRSAEHAVLFYFDLDDLKKINDKYGHGAGDGALRNVANALGACLRESDYLVRKGGDEFIGLLTMNHLPTVEELKELMTRFRASLNENPLEFDGKTVHLRISIGFHVYEYTKTLEENIKIADGHLYIDKGKKEKRKKNKK